MRAGVDPSTLTRLSAVLAQDGVVTDATLTGLEDEVAAELDDAVHYARTSPDPAPEDALEGVYA